MNSDFSLPASIRSCRDLANRSRSNFVPAFRELPREKREAMEILYAFNRFTDDLADSPEAAWETAARRAAALAEWSAVIEATTALDSAEDAGGFTDLAERYPRCSGLGLLPALRMVIDRFGVPVAALRQVVDGVASDVEPQRFATFDEAAGYCHKVATAVGLASLAVWGTRVPLSSPKLVEAAGACGIAFQWTNILRDLVEDFHAGRLYLPLEDLAFAGLTEPQLAALLDRNGLKQVHEFEKRFDCLIARQIARCSDYFQRAATLEELLERDGRRVFNRMYGVYHRLFVKIAAKPARILYGRVRLSLFEKITIAIRGR